ncbi:MAG: phenylalanine--tRNA ligase subunit alpha, partial [Bartonella sp.]|nr:phenylalanine--tRNA ligase subunit alpha [Bartonella sp.]
MNDNDIEHLEQEIFCALEAANDEQTLEAVRIGALGKRGSISEKLKALGNMSADERHKVGPALNGLKKRVLELWMQKRDALKNQAMAIRL